LFIIRRYKSEFEDIKFDNSYNRWVFTFKFNGVKNKITHIDYWTLVWARDCIIDNLNLNLNKSKLNFKHILNKNEIIDTLKSFREYIKIEKILEGKLKKSRYDIYNRKLDLNREKYDFLIKVRNKFL